MSTIGNRIRLARQEAGLSVDELAARLGKNRATVYRYESDEIENFPITVIGPLAEALHTTPAYLMGWDEKMSQNEWDSKFRDSVKQILSNANPADLEAMDISVQEIEEELSGSDPISLVTACAIADELGESLDSLLGHTPKEMIKAALQQEDGQTAKIIELLLDLPADRQQEALNYLRYLSERAEK